MNHNYCVIMCGGIGSRFWPASRQTYPKQFIDFFGTGRSLLQQTFDRFSRIIDPGHILFVTNERYGALIREQLPQLNADQILLEPCRRNTAPCIAFAAQRIRRIDPDANIVVAPSDHLILKETEFLESIEEGLRFVAERPVMLTLGIQPNRPETGYGYIQAGHDTVGRFTKVKAFTEKPNLELAKVFFESGDFYWNAGIFLWNVNTILEAFNRYLPEVATPFNQGAERFNTPEEADFIAGIYPSCPNISIDYGIMEKADNVYVEFGDFGWSDLGTWGSLHELSPKDADGNSVLKGNVLCYESHDNVVTLPQGQLAVLHKMDGYVVASSGKVLMICKKEDEQEIRQFVIDAQMRFGDDFV